jgi:hypothetical protein
MTGREYFIIIMTFITGMFAGAYLYVTSFAPSYQEDTVQEQSEITFLLHGRKTGDCSAEGSVCPSFELRSDRTYSYIPLSYMGNTKDSEINGKLGKDKFDTLLAYIDSVNLDALQKRSVHKCSTLYDTNYQYNLTYMGKSYHYDTCNTVFKESVLSTKFYPLWTRLSTTTPTAPLLEEGLTGFFRDQLDKKFKYDD